jgi:hypothetical protein
METNARKGSDPPTAHRRARALALAAGFLLALAPASARAHEYDDDGDSCQTIDGPFTSVVIAGPPCTSPLGLCTHGVLGPDFPSTYDFTFLSLAPQAADPSTQVYSGSSLVTVDQGGARLFGRDHGGLHFTGPGIADFVTVVRIVGGTNHYASARGFIVATGTVDFNTGKAVGAYHGSICRGD